MNRGFLALGIVLVTAVTLVGCGVEPQVINAPAPSRALPASGTPEPHNTEQPVDPNQVDPAELYASRLFDAANKARIAEGLAPLEFSACAVGFAQQRAADLIGQPLAHAPLEDVSKACHLSGGITGENLIRGSGAPEELIAVWLESPGHRANLLDPRFTQGAMGCVLDTGDYGEQQPLCSHLLLG